MTQTCKKVVKPSHIWLASKLNVSSKTIFRALKVLERYGFIRRAQYRISAVRYDTCIYFINDYFKVKSNLDSLKHIFNSFKRFLIKFRDKVKTLPVYESSSSSLLTLLKTKKDPVKSIYVEDNTRESYPMTWVFPKKREKVIPELEMTVTMERMKRSLGLTTNGVLKLSIFPDEAIKHVLNLSRSAKDIGNADSWLFIRCKEYCVKNNIQFKQNWRRYYDECSRRGIDPQSRITTQRLNIKAHVAPVQTGISTQQKIKEDVRPMRNEELDKQAAAILRRLFGI